jgi:hypothetical protein
MRAAKKALLGFLGALGAIIMLAVGAGGYFLARTGGFRAVPAYGGPPCAEISLERESAEDIVIDRAGNRALLSALDRRGSVSGRETLGTVKAIALTDDAWRATAVVSGAPADMRPHGLSLFAAGDGRRTLMAISHPTGKPHRVEIFDRGDDGVYAHVAGVEGPELFKPNDLAAVGARQFYLVNDTGARGAVQRAAEQLFGAGYATLVYFDGERLTEVMGSLASPGGLAVSADGKQLFVAETQAKQVTILARNPDTGVLAVAARVAIDGLPDNIDIAEDGSAWVTAHGSAVGLVRHFIDPANPAPSLVYRIERNSSGSWEARQVYASDGHNLSAGSVAATAGNRMLLGSITEYKVLACPRPQ